MIRCFYDHIFSLLLIPFMNSGVLHHHLPPKLGGPINVQNEFGGTDIESLDRGWLQKYFSSLGCSFREIADNLSFNILKLTYCL